MSLEHILVATDLSPVSLLSLPYVAGLARRTGAQVTVVYVDTRSSALKGPAFEAERDRVNEQLGIYRDAFGMLDVTCTVRVLSGKPGEVLTRLSGNGEYDLLVTTRHGERATGLLVGSTSLHLARNCHIPLLVVHGPRTDEPPLERTTVNITEILTSTDFSDASVAGLKALAPFAASLGAQLHVVHVVTTSGAVIDLEQPELVLPEAPSDARAEVHAAETRLTVLAQRLGYPHVSTQVVCAEVAADGIVAAALVRGSTVLAVPSHGKGRIASILLGSTSRRVLTLSPLPVLVLRRDALGGPAWQPLPPTVVDGLED